MWTDWYSVKVGMDVSVPRRGEVIIYELEISKSILSKYAIYLEDQDDCNLFSFSKIENSQPDTGNFTFLIISNRP